ncbi:MAG: glucosamine-6-phosphate deaminase [Firmicutes bacterium HGW-Firmicutes-20]|jgi:glucosamine-6-phosphate deaminase|nr:MAG: glucosamine-6-phosphate deaminase [Firmicutes bacterium HGW-Firmicutes-20]PKM67617.1 MAG: glucosamine-6-phosphate deaminase [Firmicutes bacterium HGW-Firmicutes-19]
MKLFIEKDYNALSKKTAELVVKAVLKKPNLIFCLPAGGSPIGMYQCLVEMFNKNEVSFKDMITYDMDEYVGLAADNENVYACFMQKHFLKFVDVKNENVFYPNGLADDLDKMCAEYSEQIFAKGGLDLAITGIGSNGHIAFNEPGEKLIARTHVVELDETTIKNNARFFDGNMELVPRQAISIGMEDIMKSKLFLVVASGKHKAELIKRTFENTDIDPMWPVSFLRMHPNCIFIIDEDAASLTDIEILRKYI